MRQDGPVGARDLGALHRARPECTQPLGIAGLGELAYRRPVPAIERLLQQLRGVVLAAGQKHGTAVQLVIGFLVGAGEPHLDQDLPKLGGRQASADDRAVEVGGDLPDAPTPWLRHLRYGHRLEQSQAP